MSPLFAVRDRLRERGLATPRQLAAELELPLAVVEAAVAHLERRGKVRAAPPAAEPGCGTGRCGSCRLCFTAGPDVPWVRWSGPPAGARRQEPAREGVGRAHG
ncbi:MAG TPA: FeoC-like transcriptional regulator, partial [Trueperaceae bacterium]|nr:FeoC-like transcriptional regulator [Trueperaceae bacterium]